MSKNQKRARSLERLIKRNVDNFYSDSVTWEQFDKRACALWRAVRRLGVEDEVLDLVRPGLGVLNVNS